jgi:hypothetical protein
MTTGHTTYEEKILAKCCSHMSNIFKSPTSAIAMEQIMVGKFYDVYNAHNSKHNDYHYDGKLCYKE